MRATLKGLLLNKAKATLLTQEPSGCTFQLVDGTPVLVTTHAKYLGSQVSGEAKSSIEDRNETHTYGFSTMLLFLFSCTDRIRLALKLIEHPESSGAWYLQYLCRECCTKALCAYDRMT